MNSFVATGGVERIVGNFKVHTFYRSESFLVKQGSSLLEVLVVGGGGSGGPGIHLGGSGGGALQTITRGLIREGEYRVSVGSGGVKNSSGQESSVFGIRAAGGASYEKEPGIAVWHGSSDKSAFISDISGELKRYAGNGGNNLINSKEAAESGQYKNGGGGGFGNYGDGFDGIVVIRYKV